MNDDFDLAIGVIDCKTRQDRRSANLENPKPSCVQKIFAAEKRDRRVFLALLISARGYVDNIVCGKSILNRLKQLDPMPVIALVAEILPTDFAVCPPARIPVDGFSSTIAAAENSVAARRQHGSDEFAETIVMGRDQHHSPFLPQRILQMRLAVYCNPIFLPGFPIAPGDFYVLKEAYVVEISARSR